MIDFVTNIFSNAQIFIGSSIENIGYIQLLFIVALESTAFPLLVPVEAIVIPLGYFASIGKKNIILLGLSCSLGVLLGCLINYCCSYFIGRFAIYKYSKYFLIKHSTIEKMENAFLKNAEFIIFVGRFIPIPGVKHLVTLPAGFSGMNIKKFILFSFLGGIVFTTMNLSIGYFFGAKKDVVGGIITKIMIALCMIIFLKIYKKRLVEYMKTNFKKLADF